MSKKKVTKKPKRRVPVAKPSKRHKSVKDYDRKKKEQILAFESYEEALRKYFTGR